MGQLGVLNLFVLHAF